MSVVPDVVALAVFTAVGVLLIRYGNRRAQRIARAWPPSGQDRYDPAGLTGEHLGYLSGRGPRAIEAAAARLRIGGAVVYHWSTNTFAATGRRLPVDERTALSTAVLSAVSTHTPIGELDKHPKVQTALRQIGADLDDTWTRTDVPPRHFVSAGAPVIALSVAALAWALVPPFRGPTDVPLILLALVGAVAGAVVGSRPVPMETIRLRTIRRAKERNAHLDPGMRPALSTYGPAAAALAVGLFGLSVMESTDLPLSSVSVAEQMDAAARAAYVPEDEDDDGMVYGCGGFDGASGGGSAGGGAGCGGFGI